MSAAQSTPLTPDQIGQFESGGYVVIDAGLPASLLDAIPADLAGVFSGARPVKLPYRDNKRLADAWRIHDGVLRLAAWPAILAALEQLYGRRPLPFQTLNFNAGTEQRPHSDTIHFDSRPSGFMCGVWTALEDIDETNGPLVYYPGSHKLPQVTFKDVKARPTHLNYGKYEDYIEAMLEEASEQRVKAARLERRLGIVKKGQALIWAANLIHGGAAVTDRSRTRHSQVTHYYFEGCRYFSPMHSNDRFTFWTYPVWVRSGPIQERRVPRLINSLRWRAARLFKVI